MTLRWPSDDDLEAIWEQCQDAEMQRWTTIPVPYSRDDARMFVRHLVPGAWATGDGWTFAIEAEGRFVGSVSLRNLGAGRAELGYGAHPWARGRGLMTRAVRLLLGWGFAERDLRSVLWQADRGNWASRRLAWRVGFTHDGLVRDALPRRDGLADAWVGTLRRGEELTPRTPWLDVPVVRHPDVVLRPVQPADLPRIVEVRSDPEVQHWLQGHRESAPHTLASNAQFVDDRLEAAASGTGLDWAVADPMTDEYLGQVTLTGLVHRREAELAYWAHQDARGRGLTRTAAGLAVRHCFVPWEDGGLGLHRLRAEAADGNDSSHRLLRHLGFTRTGVSRQDTLLPDGSWADSVTYDLLATDLD